jgi:D-alanyl-D-alanine carboxypeptidase/D-alanyl-D-alanine-endopeptidase (penicillin-binding protein 4)
MKLFQKHLFRSKKTAFLAALFITWILSIQTGISAPYDFKNLRNQLGPHDAVIVADPLGIILFSHNPDKALMPASTLKLLTALTAFHYLGSDYRFCTEFYLDPASNLKIKGYGDPLLISEVLDDISDMLAKHLRDHPKSIQNIIIDHAFFNHPIIIPGVTDSSQPYDAPNGALCVNFNTVNFEKIGAKFVSAEPQTPLLPIAIKRIQSSGLTRGRVRLSIDNQEIFYYAGHLFKYFFESKGINIAGRIKMGQVYKTDERVLLYASPYTLEQAVMKMMTYSNNFIANQILLRTGAYLFDTPGTLQKAVDAAHAFAREELGNAHIRITEGSGISRKNRVTASGMLGILNKFKPYHHLLTKEGHDIFKTGTLKDVSTRVGYINPEGACLYPYVILINSPNKSAHSIAEKLQRILLPNKSIPGEYPLIKIIK